MQWNHCLMYYNLYKMVLFNDKLEKIETMCENVTKKVPHFNF